MSLRGRVGRHTKLQGRNCQNWTDDQTTVIALLNRIAAADGGAGGSLAEWIVNGVASAALYGAISHFEDKHFPGQRSGFVDPRGAMLTRMEELAARSGRRPRFAPDTDPPIIPKRNMLDQVLAAVLDENAAEVKHFTARERIDFVPLIIAAAKHIKDLRERGRTELLWGVGLFGRAHVHSWRKWAAAKTDGTLIFYDHDKPGGMGEKLPLPLMLWGFPVERNLEITTGKLGALLLYGHGAACRVRPYHTGHIAELGERALSQPGGKWTPQPIAGAGDIGIQ